MMTDLERLDFLERNAKSPLPGQEQEAETLLWLIALARIGAAVQPRPMNALEFFNAETRSPGVGAAFDKAAHVLSEWLNDAAPIGEARYRQPFIDALKAFNEAFPQAPQVKP